MKTHTIKAVYTLTEDAYRAEVASATGPVKRNRSIEFPVGDITPEARLALLDTTGGYYSTLLADKEIVDINVGERADAPTAADASATILGMAVTDAAQRAEVAADKLAAEQRATEKQAKHLHDVGDWLSELERAAPAQFWMAVQNKYYGISGRYDCPGIYRARWDALEARAEADAVARKAADERHRAGLEHEARLWAAEHGAALSPELQRAAREGRLVLAEIQRLVGKRLGDAIADCSRWHLTPDKVFGQTEIKGVPSMQTYAQIDALTAMVPSFIASVAIPGLAAKIGPPSRYDINPKNAAVLKTGIKVTVSHPWCTCERIAFAERPVAPDEDEDEDDEDNENE